MSYPFEDKQSDSLKKILSNASLIASENNHEVIGQFHILLSILESKEELVKLLKIQEVNIGLLKKYCQKNFSKIKKITKSNEPQNSAEIKNTFLDANVIRRRFEDKEFKPIHIFLAVIKDFGKTELERFSLNNEALENASMQRVPDGANFNVNKRNIGESSLAKFCTNITTEALEGKLEPLVGRFKELREVYEVLGRKNKRNIILRGEPGVGKSTLVNGLAQLISNQEVPDFLKGSNLLTLDVGALMAGASYRGELEDRIKKMIAELQRINNPILFIDEIHMLVDKEGTLGGGFVNILKPELANGGLTVIGATTNDEYRKSIEKDKAFRRRFAIIDVYEPIEKEAEEIIDGILPSYKEFHGLEAQPELSKELVRLAKRYIKEQALPDSAIDLLDRTFAAVKTSISTTPQILKSVNNQIDQLKDKDDTKGLHGIHSFLEKNIHPFLYGQLKSSKISTKANIALDKLIQLQVDELASIVSERELVVSNEDVAATISIITNIPVGKIQSSEKTKLANIENELRKRVVGQEHALKLTADSIRQFRTGLEEPGKPASFFLLGPTGTGKTELAKSLATFLFDNQDSLIRFDMSEYRSEQSGELLLGAPPGYVGYDEGGVLVNKIRENSFSVVLFDEIEKAHNSIYKIFLQLLDEGKITDRQNRIGDFSNAIILFTSNLGAEEIVRFSVEEGRLPSSKELENLMVSDEYWSEQNKEQPYSKEFLARITSLVPFSPITSEVAIKILQIQLGKLIKQLSLKDIELNISKAAIGQLLKEGFNPILGARPLKNVIRHRVRSPIANLLVSSESIKKSINIDYINSQWIVK